MLRYVNYDIVFQEIPNEITLAINISNCPHRCEGCHSPYLWEDTGTSLDEQALSILLQKYGDAITCICFMGGDAEPREVGQLADFIRKNSGDLKIAWYSGRAGLPADFSLTNFDYVKLGAYVKHLGGLNAPTTNQRFYRIENEKMIDRTSSFHTYKN
jgi:anaerobic ribonucleoside-triphosphate reductase activating protein